MTLADLIRRGRVNFSVHPRLRSNAHALWDGSRAWVSAQVADEIAALSEFALIVRAELLEIVELWPEVKP